MIRVKMLHDKRVCLQPWEQPTKLIAGQSYDLKEELASCLINEKAAQRAQVQDKAVRGAPRNKGK